MSLKRKHKHIQTESETDPSVQNVIQKKDCQCNAEEVIFYIQRFYIQK